MKRYLRGGVIEILAACSLIESDLPAVCDPSAPPCCRRDGTTTSLYRLGRLPSTRKPSSSALDQCRTWACHSSNRICLCGKAGSIEPALSTTRCRRDAIEVNAALASLSMASEAANTCAPISGTMWAKCEVTV